MTIVSIDPGTLHCGVAVWKLDNKTLSIKNIKTFTIEIDNNYDLEDRLTLLKKRLTNLWENIDEIPLHLVHESAFMNRLRPQAYGPIYTTIYIIRKSFLSYYKINNKDRIFAYPPKLVKSFIIKGDANKNDILNGVKKTEELITFIDETKQSEHEIDAIAIGYTHIVNIRNYKEILTL